MYATAEELAAILKVNPTTNADALERVLEATAGEIDSEIGLGEDDDPLEGWQLALAEEVALERAQEHWAQLKAPFGIIGLGTDTGAVYTARDSWDRHALKLAPLKNVWGMA